MEHDSPDSKKTALAFVLIALILLVCSLPQVQRFADKNLQVTAATVSCMEAAIPTSKLHYLAIALFATGWPVTLLYSNFIHKKFGVRTTKFHGRFNPELHYKEFISSNILNKVFGLALFFVWLSVCGLLFYGAASFVRCSIIGSTAVPCYLVV